MANQQLFSRIANAWRQPAADTQNEAGGAAYALSARQALAQYAVTGCLNSTFYAAAEMQLEQVLALCEQNDPNFVAQTAVYARQQGYMKDMPALLVAWLSTQCHQEGADSNVFPDAFKAVIDNGKMLRNFVQIMRSGAVGRQSLGTRPKRLVQSWLRSRTPQQLLAASVGQQPSLRDVLRMTHPRPKDAVQAATFAYFAGKPYDAAMLPDCLADYEAYKHGHHDELPDVPFQLLTALPLGASEWRQIAARASWQMTRMNLNTFARHGVFADRAMTQVIARRLADRTLIRRARVFPYQLMMAYHQVSTDVPDVVVEALQAALDVALENVPAIPGRVVVMPDVSGSMHSPVTGFRQGATSQVRCIDVAALLASAIQARNPETRVMPFDTKVHNVRLNPRDSVLTRAGQLARYGGGGTALSTPVAQLNREKAQADLLVYVSDNESWADSSDQYPWRRQNATAMAREWAIFKGRNPQARLVCLDIQPYANCQVQEQKDVLNIGGFADTVFTQIQRFADGTLSPDHWVGEIEAITF